MIWFTSDTHFGHRNIIRYARRPFDTVEEMDATMIANWNAVVHKGDTVYHLGDFALRHPIPYLEALNGKVVFVKGSHDSWMRDEPYLRELELDIEEYPGEHRKLIVMCHYSMRSWNKSHYGSWHLFGHHHGNLPGLGFSMDVGVDAHNFRPISLNEVKHHMAMLERREYVVHTNEATEARL